MRNENTDICIELTGLDDLNKAVYDSLDSDKLKTLWVAGQRHKVNFKITGS